MIGLKNLGHFFSQSEVKPKQIATGRHVFTLSFDWFTGLYVSFMIGYSDNYGFRFRTLKLKLKPL